MTKTLYRHPYGMGTIRHDAQTQTLHLINALDGTEAYALIGPHGLRELAAKLLALADKLEC